MRFQEVVGQTNIREHLIETYRAGRTAHAQLFLGSDGAGQLALALAYAQYLLCENPSETDSCGECNACRKVQRCIHPDLHFSFPTVGTGKISNDFLPQWREAVVENAYLNTEQWLNKLQANGQQGNITKNECVDIVRKLSFKANEGKYKVLILWMPEFLEKEGNRLLKLIEEPEPDTVFILVAEQLELILNTIVSRCQLVRIPALSNEEIADALTARQSCTRPRAEWIAYMAEGSWNRALTLLEESQDKQGEVFIEWMRLCYKGNGKELWEWVEQVHAEKRGIRFGRKDQVLFLQYGLHFLRECLMIQQLGDAAKPRLQGSELQSAQGFVRLVDIEKLFKITNLLDEHSYFIERNAHSKALFLSLSIQVHGIFHLERK